MSWTLLDLQTWDVPGSMSCVEKKFELQGSKYKWEEYKGTRYSHGDSNPRR